MTMSLIKMLIHHLTCQYLSRSKDAEKSAQLRNITRSFMLEVCMYIHKGFAQIKASTAHEYFKNVFKYTHTL